MSCDSDSEVEGDRGVQDLVIRALADGSFRTSEEWLAQGLADPEKVRRFSRFLARHFYYDRIVHFFKYSRALAQVTGRNPEAVLTTPAFAALFESMALGSHRSAHSVSELVVEYVTGGQSPARVPYLRDLLVYEQAMMVAEAGPRTWRDPEGQGLANPAVGSQERTAVFEKVEHTKLLSLDHDITTILQPLLRQWTVPPSAPLAPVRLVVARSPHGRVIVAHSNAAIEALLQLADGQRTLAELARDSGLSNAQLRDVLDGLVELGALRMSLGS